MTSVPQRQLDSYIPPVKNEVGNIWSLDKDGKRYFHRDRQVAVASAFARRARTAGERESLNVRWLKRLRSKRVRNCLTKNRKHVQEASDRP